MVQEKFNQEAFSNNIRKQLNNILTSDSFKESSSLREFLKYVVEETLDGNADHLKQFTIAMNAFNRGSEFDPQKDPIVRIQAGRLRQQLSAYYQNEGVEDDLLIEIPKGSYIPEFSHVERLSSQNDNKLPSKNPEILIYPFKSLSRSEDSQFLAEGFTEELIVNLSYFTSVTVIRASPTKNDENDSGCESSKDKNTLRFCLKGTIRFTGSKIKVVVTLYNAINSQIVWSTDFLEPYELDNVIEIQELVAHKVTTTVADVYGGVIVKKIYAETQKMAYTDIERFDVILILYSYLRNPTSIEYNKILDLFYSTVKKHPDFGPGWSALADILINNYLLGYTPNCPELLDEALSCSRKGVEFNPNNQLVRAVHGYCCLVNGQLEECLNQMQYAKSLNPRSAFFIGVIGFVSSLAGNWKQGMVDIETSYKLNPDYPKWYHISTTLYYLKERKFELALKESIKLDIPLILWDPVLKSVCYAYNDKTDEAKLQLDKLNEIQPDFFNKPIFYLKMLIKFDDILESVLLGLKRAGLEQMILQK